MSWLSDYVLRLQTELPGRLERLSREAMKARAVAAPAPLNFLSALRSSALLPAVIAEIKFKSPSMGMIRPTFDVEFVAQGYENAGAMALSVLVDGPYFGGDISFLGRAKSACQLPVLAKGFFVDPYDVFELRAAGADALLLMAKCLERDQLEAMLETARDLGMTALVELHDDADFQKVRGLDLDLVGVNHRNLDSLEMDMDLSRRLSPMLDPRALKVAESGLRSAEDLARMRALGFGAVLIGTGFMTHADPGEKLAGVLDELRKLPC
jgi:indole-3-glycerol phosphate synthase